MVAGALRGGALGAEGGGGGASAGFARRRARSGTRAAPAQPRGEPNMRFLDFLISEHLLGMRVCVDFLILFDSWSWLPFWEELLLLLWIGDLIL